MQARLLIGLWLLGIFALVAGCCDCLAGKVPAAECRCHNGCQCGMDPCRCVCCQVDADAGNAQHVAQKKPDKPDGGGILPDFAGPVEKAVLRMESRADATEEKVKTWCYAVLIEGAACVVLLFLILAGQKRPG